MGILALLFALVGATVTIIDGITDCLIKLRNRHKLNIRGCCSDTKKEPGMGEYGSVVIILVVLASFPGPCLAFHCLEYSVVLVSFYFSYTNCWNGCHH